MISGIHHIALKVADFNRAMDFYTNGIGLKFLREWGDETKTIAMLDTGCGIIELFSNGIKEPGEGMMPHLALCSSDVDGDYAKALAAGAKPHIEPKDFEINARRGSSIKVRLAFVVSPTGELVEFLKEY